ncbi:MAG: nicotinamide mononucleotide transporter [Clostridia bacterium]|nr:nicotinamide mononucleotide transporter [Clostridia bacterium]
MKKLIPHFTPFDLFLWGFSVLAILISYLAFPEGSGTSAIGSVIGVTALIFVAKGAVLGQFLMLAFCLFYGIHALRFRYYGEMLTYLGMSAPAAVFSIVTWLRHPFRDSAQVAVVSLSRRRVWLSLLSTVAVTVLFYFILKALGTAELLLSTFSVATSFIAGILSFQRSPWYAVGYVANDVVLIALWGVTLFRDITVLPVFTCFAVFLFNDLHGFFSWQRMMREQKEKTL